MSDRDVIAGCPFCGGTADEDNACQMAKVHHSEFKAPTGQRAYRIVCECGAQAGASTNYSEAVAIWNRRSLSPAQPEAKEARDGR